VLETLAGAAKTLVVEKTARARARAVAPGREGCAGEGGYAGGADA